MITVCAAALLLIAASGTPFGAAAPSPAAPASVAVSGIDTNSAIPRTGGQFDSTAKTDTLNRPAAPSAPRDSAALRKIAAPGMAFALDTAAQRADSLRRKTTRDSLTAIDGNYIRRNLSFPATVDSIYNPGNILPYRLFSSDAADIAEVLRYSPPVISVPYSLSSQLNRSLVYGIPLDLDEWSIRSNRFSATGGLSSCQTASLAVSPADGISASLYPLNLVSPEMAILWENGVFDENLLGVRLARPFARKLAAAVFSNYRYFYGTFYDHRTGGVQSFYRGMIGDTSLINTGGRNPLVNEQSAGLRLTYAGPRNSMFDAQYRYGDEKHEQVYSHIEDGTPKLRWERVTRFVNSARLGAQDVPILGPVFASGSFTYDRTIQKATPLSPRYGDPGGRGQVDRLSLEIKPHIAWTADTLWLRYALLNDRRDLYGEQNWKQLRQSPFIGFSHRQPFGPAFATISGEGGRDFVGTDDTTVAAWKGRVQVRGVAGRQEAALFAAQGALPYDMPLDSNDRIAAPLIDAYYSWGCQLWLKKEKVGILIGYLGTQGIDSGSVKLSWPHGLVPYSMPSASILVSPAIGRFAGFALSSRWLFSDRKPYVKAQTALSYEKNIHEDREWVQCELAVDYWSRRDRVPIGVSGNWRDWEREIFDVYLKTSVQISTFNIFLKVDNLLNRSFAYVPGYQMPGVTFRWGFSWIING
jgi:hypothetical protein